MILPISLTFLFLALSAPLVAAPLWQRLPHRLHGDEAGLENQSSYQTTMLALRDLEFDRQMGVINADDYARLRYKMMARAASEMEHAQRQKEDSVSAKIEAAVRSRRRHDTNDATDAFCPQCGQRHEADDRFCTHCGQSLGMAEVKKR